MEFSSFNNSLVVFKDKVILDLVEYKVEKIHIYNNETIRLLFENYEIKMNKGDLKLINIKTSKVIDFLQKNNTTSDIWKTYTVHPELEVSINDSCTVIKVNNENYKITKKIIHGKTNKYYCEMGELALKDNTGSWNNIGLGLKA